MSVHTFYYGGIGSGKTHRCIMAALQSVADGKQAVVVTHSHREIQRLRGRYGDKEGFDKIRMYRADDERSLHQLNDNNIQIFVDPDAYGDVWYIRSEKGIFSGHEDCAHGEAGS